jgi:lipopolysaccharide transport system ATP-binding protein
MAEDVLINCDNVGKKFCRDFKKSLWYGVKDSIADLFGRRGISSHVENSGHESQDLRYGEFWANKDVNFELKRGECIGLIGRNGAGKTTLLKMLSGLIKPDQGSIKIYGQLNALIALGAGFNPILTGRENILSNATILGLTRQTALDRLDEIVAFADLQDFIDTPLRNYSSGMQVRLGFAIATSLDPDVLILDEVLAVGDAAFRNKCYRRISKLRRQAAVIFVSHNMEQVSRICDKTLVMASGRPVHFGAINEGVRIYEGLNSDTADQSESFVSCNDPISDFAVVEMPTQIQSGEQLTMVIQVKSLRSLNNFLLRILFYNSSGAFAADCNFPAVRSGIEINQGTNFWRVVVASVPLKSGRYQLGLNIIDSDGELVVWSHKQHQLIVSHEYPGAIADCQLFLESWSVCGENSVPEMSTN